jgi:predicted nucleic-acid-binding protein
MINSTNPAFTETGKLALGELEKALDIGLTTSDFADIQQRSIAIDSIIKQLDIFKNGITKAIVKRPATVNDGILYLQEEKANEYAAFFDSKKDNFKLTKFVPASGAATRMFKFLLEFLDEFDPETETVNAFINRKKENNLKVFLVAIEKFPFYNEIAEVVRNMKGVETWKREQKTYAFIQTMLNDSRFNFSNKPKGILPFHDYESFIATPIYEHLKETVAYASSQGEANIQFTISDDHLDGFIDGISEVKETIEKESGIPINVSFSYQKKSTDTLAVNMDNTPFREATGHLFFRPGGHGALIENLSQLNADIVFIKNIDNVSHNNIHTIALYKKALAGILIGLQEQVFLYLRKIEQNEISEQDIEMILAFAKEKLLLHIPADVSKYTLENKKEFTFALLNRPIRICGMVKNEGEPGGGPFWIECSRGELSLQIVESSQIDLDNKAQKEIFSTATHFNPVDLVCGLKNYKGELFNLNEFIDNTSGFIVHKNRFGKNVKSYELPGLWNGAMAGWITIFTEVPLETFNPVKTVNDLLKPAHQPQ